MTRAVFLLFIFWVGFLGWPNFNLKAASSPLVRVYNSEDLSLESEFLPFGNDYSDELNLAAGDLGGDGIPKIIIGAGYGHEPEVRIFRLDGSLVGSFLAYPKSFSGGVRITAADLDKDGKAEIITAAGRSGGPQVRVFDGAGRPKLTPGFMAFDLKYNQGLTLTSGDVNGDGWIEIIVARTYDSPQTEVKVFDKAGKDLKLGFKSKDYPRSLDLNLAAADFGNDQLAELAVNGGYGFGSKVALRQIDGPEIASFKIFDQNVPGGINLATGDIDNDGKVEIITGPGFGEGPRVKIFDSYGRLKKDFLAYPADFFGGVKVAVIPATKKSAAKILTAPDRVLTESSTVGRQIKIEVGPKQTLFAYEDGYLVRSYLISSGTGYLHTPLGSFSIYLKRPDVRMTGPGYDLPHVPWVLSFKGPYTIHGTYWHRNFGHPMSHGCVNMYTPDARWLYGWVAIGTPVEIYK